MTFRYVVRSTQPSDSWAFAVITCDKPTGQNITLKTGIINTVDDFRYIGLWVAESKIGPMNTCKAQALTAMNKLS